MLQPFLEILLSIIHLFYSLLLSLQSKFNSACKHFRALQEALSLFENPVISHSDNAKLLELLEETPKIPSHLVVIMGNESISYCDLVKLISWSLPCGIAFLSFYDHKNVLSADQLFKAVVKYNKDILPFIKWGKAFDEEVRTNSKQLINGFRWTPNLELSVFQKEDGKQLFINATKKLCYTVSDVKCINEAVIDASIRSSCSIPEPDLAIICGNTCSSFGLLPWSLRVTEFLMLPSHRNLFIKDFTSILKKYGSVEQRFGK